MTLTEMREILNWDATEPRRKLVNKLIAVVEAAQDESILWNEDRCNHEDYNLRKNAIDRLLDALKALESP